MHSLDSYDQGSDSEDSPEYDKNYASNEAKLLHASFLSI